MLAAHSNGPGSLNAIPELTFEVRGVESVRPAAVPTLRFPLAVTAPAEQPIRSILLDVQLQIAARRRGYGRDEKERLLELFGTPERWATTVRTLPWTRVTQVVPPFTGSCLVDVLVPCTYDLEVTAAKYMAALGDGEVPLEFLFSGSVFFTGAAGALQTVRIGWDRDADYRMPVSVWREMMDQHFARSAWLRMGTEVFDRLCAYKARGAFPSWDAALDSLMSGGQDEG